MGILKSVAFAAPLSSFCCEPVWFILFCACISWQCPRRPPCVWHLCACACGFSLRKELKLNTAWNTLAHTPSTLSVGAQSSENFPEPSKSEFPVSLTCSWAFWEHARLACLSPCGISVAAGWQRQAATSHHGPHYTADSGGLSCWEQITIIRYQVQ